MILFKRVNPRSHAGHASPTTDSAALFPAENTSVLAGRIIDSQGLGATIRADMTSIPGTLMRSMINPISPDILTFRYSSALGTFADRNLGG